MNNPLVSIIIPTYNRAHFIGETLESVIAQTYQNWECIIVDDGSSDYTDELMDFYFNKDTRIQYHHRPSHKPKGANACRNYGFDLSNGEYIIFLDDDDILEKSCLEIRISSFVNEIDFVIANTAILLDDRKKEIKIYKILNKKDSEDYLLSFLKYEFPWWSVMSAMWRRKLIRNYKFDENLERFQDIDFHIRILQNGQFKFKKIDKIDNYYRIDQKKRNGNVHSVKVINSLFILLEKYSTDFSENRVAHLAFKKYFYIISRDFIFFNYRNYSRNFRKIFKITKKTNFFDNKDRLIFLVYYFYTLLKAKDKKGLGVHKFRKFSNKYYDNLNHSL